MTSGLITIPQAAQILGVHVRTAQLEVKNNGSLAGVTVVQINGRNRVSAEAIKRVAKGEAA